MFTSRQVFNELKIDFDYYEGMYEFKIVRGNRILVEARAYTLGQTLELFNSAMETYFPDTLAD